MKKESPEHNSFQWSVQRQFGELDTPGERIRFPFNNMPVHPMPSPVGMDPRDPGGPGGPMYNHDHLKNYEPKMRHTPFVSQPDYRIYELNKRLQQRTEESDNLWWDAFASEFFEEDATLTLSFCLEDGPKRYSIGRTLIPRYFRSIFEGGVTDLYYVLKHPKESFHNTSITLDCEQATMITHHGKPMFTKVCTEGRLVLEFTFDDLMRIRTWHFAIRQHRELIPRSVIAMQYHSQDPQMLEQLSKNITRQGLTNQTLNYLRYHTQDLPMLEHLSKNVTRQGFTNYTLNYLRLCVILEPMQELMSRHKAYSLSPRDCLKTTLFQKWQRMVAPPENLQDFSPGDTYMTKGKHKLRENSRPPSKRRKRKSSATSGSTPSGNNMQPNSASNPGAGGKKKPASNFPLTSQVESVTTDVMVVGEPSLMGGEFGEEDERLITRLQNTQYDATNGIDAEEEFDNSNQSPWNAEQKVPPTSTAPTPQESEKTSTANE